MSEERLYFVNGLPALYDALKKAGHESEGKKLIENFLINSFKSDIQGKISRFLDTGIPPIPADMKYFRLYTELLQVYINGLFYSTVVLAGVLAERICFDIIATQNIQVGNKQLSDEQISCLYEMNFSRILELLFAWNLIGKETKGDLFMIYEKRNQYAHPKMKNIRPEHDSLSMLKKITGVLVREFV